MRTRRTGTMGAVAAALLLLLAIACESDGGEGSGGAGSPFSISGGEPAGGGGDGSGGGSARAAFDRLCDKLVECGMPSEYRTECQQVSAAYQAYVINADAVARCIDGHTCEALQSAPENIVEGCLDLDWESFRCDDLTLHYCANDGQCRDIDCVAACAQAYPGNDSVDCGHDEDDAHMKCLCIDTIVVG